MRRESSPNPDMSRRKFLKTIGAGVAAAGTGISFPAMYEGVRNELEKEELTIEIKKLETELTAKYGIRIKIWEQNPNDRPTGTIRKSLKDHSLLRSYRSLQSLAEALDHYPPQLIKDHISGIDIVYDVKSAYADPSENIDQQAVTSFGGHITIEAGNQSPISYTAAFGETLEQKILHHEIAHTLTSDLLKEEWRKIHTTANYVGDSWTDFRDDKPKGFALPYATKNIDEDIATTAELLFIDSDELQEIIKDDAVLKSKVDFLRDWYDKKVTTR